MRAAVADNRGEGWCRRFHRNRPRRVLLLLAAVWIVQGFDLGFTLVAHQSGTFAELNPAGGWLLQRGPVAVIVFKAALVLLASVILWCGRTRLLSECLLWLVAAACVGLALRWRDYFTFFHENAHDIAIVQSDESFVPAAALRTSVHRAPGSLPAPGEGGIVRPAVHGGDLSR
ncbi:MAG: DUF5658 family protein [Phycisphaerae bacterium]